MQDHGTYQSAAKADFGARQKQHILVGQQRS
jgi:hypothetical protein